MKSSVIRGIDKREFEAQARIEKIQEENENRIRKLMQNNFKVDDSSNEKPA